MWPMITAAFIYGCLAGAVWRATAKVWLLPVPLTLLLLFKAFIALVNKNLSYAGKAAKAAFNGNPQKTVKYLKMAHLIGATEAAKGIVDPSYDKKDGNGTSMQKYGQGAVQDFDKYTKFVEKAQKCPDK